MDFNSLLKALGAKPNSNGLGSNLGPFYSEPGLGSVGGSVQMPFGGPQVGGTMGVENGTPFTNVNVNGEPIIGVGPGADRSLVDVGGNHPVAPAPEILPSQFGPEGSGFSQDNIITNDLVKRGLLPQDRAEIYPQMQQGGGPIVPPNYDRPVASGFDGILKFLQGLQGGGQRGF